MTIVYTLYHVIERDSWRDDEKLIGIYTTREKAEAALRRAVDKPGFRDHKDKFEILDLVVDRDGWTEGFFNPDDELE